MERVIIDKANEIIKLIDENKNAVLELEKYAESGKTLYSERDSYMSCTGFVSQEPIHFEDWEIRLMIHNKKQRIAALENQLEQL